MPTLTGTGNNDTLTGGSGDDTILGLGGNDSLTGGDGNDFIDGGLGSDIVRSGLGDDRVLVGRGDDVRGDEGNDTLTYVGNDASGLTTYADGAVGNDTFIADFSSAVDSISSYNSGTGGSIANVNYYNMETVSIVGGSASDSLAAGNGNDTLSGGTGNDTLLGGLGVNDLTGGAGVDFGSVDLTGRVTNLSLAFNGGAANQNIGGSVFHTIEGLGLVSGSGNDDLDVTDELMGSRIYGMAGLDTLTGAAAYSDLLDGGDDADLITFGRGDTVNGGNGDDTFLFSDVESYGLVTYVDGQAGSDLLELDFSAATDALSGYNSGTGGAINNLNFYNMERLSITGGSASDTLAGGIGDDTLIGGKGHDVLDAGAGVTAQLINGGAGRDLGKVDLSGSSADLVVNFTGGVDIMLGVTTVTQVEGLGLKAGGGDDKLNVAKEKLGSQIYGGFGADTLTGGANYADLLDGQDDDDLIVFGRGDTANAGNGNDTMKYVGADASGLVTYADGQVGIDKLIIDLSKAVDAINSYNSGTGGSIAGINYYNMENVSLVGGSASDSLQAGNGADTVVGGTGNDTLDGGKGINSLNGGAGVDLAAVDLSDTSAALTVNFTGANINIGGNSISAAEGLSVVAGAGTDMLKVLGESRGSYLFGNGGNDTIIGASAYGDSLDGGDGNDQITLGRGDTVNGGNNDDDLRLTDDGTAPATTYVDGQAGSDTFKLDMSSATLDITSYGNGSSGGIAASGQSYVNYYNMEFLSVQTGSGADSLVGGADKDTLASGAGADTVLGGSGDDVITGGLGKDSLTGGTGADTFKFLAIGETALSAPNADLITDFASGDRIDLSAIDAVAGGSDNHFTWVGTNAVNGAGKLGYSQSGGQTLITGDVDGGGADFTIVLTGTITLADTDFVL